MNASLSRRASCSRIPHSTSIPAARNIARPCPLTSGFGSCMAVSTRVTPASTRALVDAGVTRVVTAMQDPNPEVNGHGLAMLRAAGIEVECGILEQEARRLNEAFITYTTGRRPFGVLKIAM